MCDDVQFHRSKFFDGSRHEIAASSLGFLKGKVRVAAPLVADAGQLVINTFITN
jgi:hypothetical protein